jgi:chromosome segregation ATPase
LDSDGSVIKTYSSVKKAEVQGPSEWPDVQKPNEVLPVEAGLNRFTWNLRYDDPVIVPGTFYEADIPPKGAMALPGTYQVRLTVAGKSQTVALEIRLDPRVNASRADLEKQFSLEQKITRSLTSLHKAVNEIRDLRAQLRALNQRNAGVAAWEPLRAPAEKLIEKITAIEEQLIQVNMKSTEADLAFPTMLDEQLISLNYSVDADTSPTQSQQQTYELLGGSLSRQLGAWDGILTKDLSELNRLAEKQKISLVDVRAK